MENKKTLWIIAAVGAFLLVVLGAALIVYSQTARSNQTIAKVSPADLQNNGWSNPNGDINSEPIEHQLNFPNRELPQTDEPLKANEVYVLADKANVYGVATDGTTIDLNSLKENNNDAPAQDKNINVTVTFADKDKPSVNRERAPRDLEKPAPKTVAKAEPSKSAKSAPAVVKKSEPKASAVKVNTAPAAPAKYWVQVAAYSNKKGAENARSTLGTNQIQADIFTYKDNKENLFYRVRVGPYTTKSEAEYWRQKIAKINDFTNAKSYVTATN